MPITDNQELILDIFWIRRYILITHILAWNNNQPLLFPLLGQSPPLCEREHVIIHDAVWVVGCHNVLDFCPRPCRFPHDVFVHRFESSGDEVINYLCAKFKLPRDEKDRKESKGYSPKKFRSFRTAPHQSIHAKLQEPKALERSPHKTSSQKQRKKLQEHSFDEGATQNGAKTGYRILRPSGLLFGGLTQLTQRQPQRISSFLPMGMSLTRR